VCLAELGAFAEGRAQGEDALRLAEMVDHPYSLAWACAGVGHLALRQGDLSQAMRVLERGLALSDAMHLPLSLMTCKARVGAAYALAGQGTEALLLLEQVLELAGARQAQQYPFFAVWLGESYVLADRVADAIPLARRVLEAARAERPQGYQAYALRLLGEIAAHGESPDVAQAATRYHQALALADELGMRPLVAHCHHGLGTLYLKIGRTEQAGAELSAAIALYRAMEMAFWLPQAETALVQVA
jgi:tetratricopeptide (TPR) repeat protein